MTLQLEVTKRDGRKEKFSLEKIVNWIYWSGNIDTIPHDRWFKIVSTVYENIKDSPEITTKDIQLKLIEELNKEKSWKYSLMSGRLYAAHMRKVIFGKNIPTVYEQHQTLADLDVMVKLNYTKEEYDIIETFIDHNRDFELSYSQVFQLVHKYSLQDKVKKKIYETPQFIFMRMAMALAEDEKDKLKHVKKFYDYFSLSKLSAPTPNYTNLGTKNNGYASCCLYITDDDAKSLAIGDHIAYTMTYMSAGIGSHINCRSINDPVRAGLIRHQGKLPYYRALAGAITANLQGGRGGACVTHISVYDPEILDVVNMQNPRTPLIKRNRDIRVSVLMNRFFVEKVFKKEKIFSFNVFTAPDLTEALYQESYEKFKELYEKYEQDPNFKKTYVDAMDLAIQILKQCHEVGTLHIAFTDEINRHTPHLDTIYSSNLCQEIVQPTKPYMDMRDLYSPEGGVEKGEISLCSLAAIVVPNIKDDAEYRDVCYYALLMIDKCIDKSHYVFPHLETTAKGRRNAGVGMIGIAYNLAKNNFRIGDDKAFHYVHWLAERHAYYVIEASLRLGKEKGNAPYIDRTKWKDGWTPLASYNRNVDSITDKPFKHMYDWEKLSEAIEANGGIRNSTLIAMQPTESSSKATGYPNGVYPIRDIYLLKTDLNNSIDWIARDSDELAEQYHKAWDISTEDLIKYYSIIQKFCDQAISADFYINRIRYQTYKVSQLLEELYYMYKYGLKTRYYTNSLTLKGEVLDSVDKGCAGGSCTL